MLVDTFVRERILIRVFVLHNTRRTLELLGCHRGAAPYDPLAVFRHQQVLLLVDDDGWPSSERFGRVDLNVWVHCCGWKRGQKERQKKLIKDIESDRSGGAIIVNNHVHTHYKYIHM